MKGISYVEPEIEGECNIPCLRRVLRDEIAVIRALEG